MKNIRSLGIAAIVFLALAVLASTFASGSDIVVSGRLRHLGVLQLGDATPSSYETTTERYVVVAEAVDVGIVVPLDHDLVQSLCADVDGCAVVFQMVDKFAGQPGNVHSRMAHLFLSETSDWWRLSVDVVGQDNNDAASQWDDITLDECRFTDAEASSGINASNDASPGFGLLNISGGTTNNNSCRLLISD